MGRNSDNTDIVEEHAIIYVCSDGSKYADRSEAEKHDRFLKYVKFLNIPFRLDHELSSIYTFFSCGCVGVIGWYKVRSNEDADILSKIFYDCSINYPGEETWYLIIEKQDNYLSISEDKLKGILHKIVDNLPMRVLDHDRK